jgi:hypothetical protein
MQATGSLEQSVGELERAARVATVAKHDRHELVVSERGRAEPLQLLSRAIV